MKKRNLYVLLFSLPALLASFIVSFFIFGVFAGVLWLFVLGDDSWPSSVDSVLVTLFVVSVCGLWLASMVAAYSFGKKLEAHLSLNSNHVIISLGSTVFLALVIAFHQWGVGNIGAKSDSVLCSEYCLTEGYNSSGMPPRDTGDKTCFCYDAQGREAKSKNLSLTDFSKQESAVNALDFPRP